MSKAHMPLSPDLIMTTKGNAAPVPTVAPTQNYSASPSPANDPIPDETPTILHEEAPVSKSVEPMVPQNFRVKKSFKRAFDQAAFDVEMSNVDFLQYLFKLYQEQRGNGKN